LKHKQKERVNIVYVVDKNGRPLMPTKHFGKVKHMLRDGRATIYLHRPFTIRLCYETPGKTQSVVIGVDPGRTNIGLVSVSQKGEVLYAAKVETRNKDVSKLIAERAVHRRASRIGERQRRKRRARKHGTTTKFPNGRKLPGYKDGVLELKDIINQEARFNNRKRAAKWLAPTARHLLQTHQNLLLHVRRFLPITAVAIEHNKFAFMLLEDGTVRGADFQNGRLKGYESVAVYVRARQNDKCEICGAPIEHIHHIQARSENGSNLPENLVGLCSKCHEAVHVGKKEINIKGFAKKYASTSVLNQALPHFLFWLETAFGDGNVRTCAGWETKVERKRLGFSKDHHYDAVSIISACGHPVDLNLGGGRILVHTPHLIMQFRHHDRQIIHCQFERTYKVVGDNGKLISVVKNRKPRFEQPKSMPALNVWYDDEVKRSGQHKARLALSQLVVVKSNRRYKNPARVMPGTVFRYEDDLYVMQGSVSYGQYFCAIGQGKRMFSSKKCEVLCRRGLIYL